MGSVPISASGESESSACSLAVSISCLETLEGLEDGSPNPPVTPPNMPPPIIPAAAEFRYPEYLVSSVRASMNAPDKSE